jgi:hypothetical protein
MPGINDGRMDGTPAGGDDRMDGTPAGGDDRSDGTPMGGDDRSDAGTPGRPPTTGIPAPVGRDGAATAGAPVVMGSGVAGAEESMLISP